jgi:hypothetical protein
MARHHRPPLSALAARWTGNYQRSGNHPAASGGQTLLTNQTNAVLSTPAQPTLPQVPSDLKGKTEFFPDAAWRNALVEHLQSGRAAQAKSQLTNWRSNGEHAKCSLRLLCNGETRHYIHDINFSFFDEKDFERVSLSGITFKRSVFPEGGEAFKKALEARGATFAGYRIGEQPYVVATQPASARGSQGR